MNWNGAKRPAVLVTPVPLEGLGGLVEAPEGDARPQLVGRRVRGAPRIAEPGGQIGELGARGQLPDADRWTR